MARSCPRSLPVPPHPPTHTLLRSAAGRFDAAGVGPYRVGHRVSLGVFLTAVIIDSVSAAQAIGCEYWQARCSRAMQLWATGQREVHPCSACSVPLE